MNIETYFSQNDIFLIIGIVIITFFLKRIAPRGIYVYIPFFIILIIVIILFLINYIELKEILITIIKLWAGAVLFYDAIIEKFEKSKFINKNGNKNRGGNDIK